MVDSIVDLLHNWKKELLFLLLGFFIIGSLYKIYFKNYLKPVGSALITQGYTYGDTLECSFLLNSKNSIEINNYLEKISKKNLEIKKSDALISTIGTIASGQKNKISSGLGVSLELCKQQLEQHLKSIKIKQDQYIYYK